jgi:hypothetical protein
MIYSGGTQRRNPFTSEHTQHTHTHTHTHKPNQSNKKEDRDRFRLLSHFL